MLALSALARAQEVRVTKPEKAYVLFTSGKQLFGDLIFLNAQEVRFQAVGQGRYTHKASKIKAVQTRDALYTYNMAKRVFEVAKATQQDPTSTAGGNANAAGTKGKTQRVIAEGLGASPEKALKSAFRDAVRQVVGAVVDAETRVKNDEVIDDQVLTYSDGFITSYKKLTEKKEEGLYRIKIRADVERRSVIAKLKDAKIAVQNVDGQGLFAEAVTQMQAEKDARAFLEKALKGYPFGCLRGEMAGKPTIVERDDVKAKIRVNLAFSADAKAYARFAARFQRTLKGIAKDGGEFVLPFSNPDNDPRGPFHAADPALRAAGTVWAKAMPKAFPPPPGGSLPPGGFQPPGDFDPGVHKIPLQTTPPLAVTIALTTQVSQLNDRSLWSYYILDESVRDVLVKLASQIPRAKVSLLDGDGKVLAVDQFPLNLNLRMTPAGFPTRYCVTLLSTRWGPEGRPVFTVSPLFFQDSNATIYLPVITTARDLSLSLDELRALRTVKCEVLID
jgi:hypothetical protein